MASFSHEQLNFFKFSTVVLDEFPEALRKVFVCMWDTLVASPTGVPKWDDSVTVLNMFIAKEGGVKKAPNLNKSYKEWDCTALFKATLFAQTFAVPDGTGGFSTLDKFYVRPRGLSTGSFHPSVISPTGDQAETYALALDQLRLLRNTLFHQISTRKIDKATFDNYILLAKGAFTALGQNTTRINEIGKLHEKEFPTTKQQQLVDELKKEKDAAIKFKQIEDHLTKIESQLKDVWSDVKDVKTEVTDMKRQVKEVGSDVKDVKTEETDVKARVEEVRSDMKDVKTEVADINTQVKSIGSNVAGIEQAIKAGSSKGPWEPKSGIPDKIPHFVGRQKECQVIVDHLTDEFTRLVGVWGPPGFGKTSVAKTVAHTLREMNVPVYFASLSGMTKKCHLVSTLLGIFADAKQEFYIPAPQYLIQCLQQQDNSFVLILDNADDLLESGDVELKEEVLRFIKEILGKCRHIKLLITYRESLDYLGDEFPTHAERVGVLDKVASADLVKLLLPDVSENDQSSIVEVCGQVPLAVRLMCKVVAEEHTPVSKLLEDLNTSPLFEVLDVDGRLKVIIDTCFAKLAKQDRDAVVSLAVICGSFGICEAKNVLNLKNDQQTKKRLRSLRRKSLIECGDDFESCIIHSLFRSYIEENSKADQETCAVFIKAKHFYNLHNFEAANERFLTGHSPRALEAFYDDREGIIISLVHGAKDDEVYVKVVRVLSKAEILLFTALNDEELLFNSIYDAVLEEATRRRNVVDKRKLLAAKSFGHWGWFSSDRQTWDISSEAHLINAADCPGKLQCYYGVRQILCGKLEEGMRSLKRSVDRLTSSCDEEVLKRLVYKVLADCHRRKQEYEMASQYEILCSRLPATTTASLSSQQDVPQSELMKAMNRGIFLELTAYLTSLVKQEEADPAAHRRQFKSVVHDAALFSRCHNSNGQFDGINTFKEFTALLINHRGQRNHCLSVRVLNGISTALGLDPEDVDVRSQLSGLFPSSLDQIPRTSSLHTVHKYNFTKLLIEAILERHQSLTYGGHRVVGNAGDIFLLSPLAGSLFRTTFENALNSYGKVPGADFDDLARSYDKLGNLLFLMDDFSGAEELFQRALRLREENNPVEIASTLTNLGHVYFKMNNEAEAEKAFGNAFELRKWLGVYDHVDTADIHDTLGENHLSRDNFTKALGAYQDALELRKHHLGEHALTAASFDNVGHVFYMMGDYESAKEAFQEAKNMSSKFPGEERKTASYSYNLALTYYHYPDLVLARMFCEEALAMRQELGEDEEIANCLDTLGRIHFKLGEFTAAIDASQTALRLAQETLGDHTRTAAIFLSSGSMYRELGDNKSAVEAFQEASRIRSNLLGYHKDTAESYHWLGVAQYDMGDLNGALGSFQTALRMRKQVLGDHPDTTESLNLGNRVYEDLSAKVLDCD